jgi:hypothetical protein
LLFSRGKQDQQLHRLALNAQRNPLAPQLKASAVELEIAELKDQIGQDTGQGTSRLRGRMPKYVTENL